MTTGPRALEDPQDGMFDEELEDAELEEALGTINGYAMQLAIFKEQHPTRGTVNKARKLVKETIETLARERELRGGERIRVGRYVIPVVARSGGDFSVPGWSKVGPNLRQLELFQPGNE